MQQFSVDEFKPSKDEVLYSDPHMSIVRYEDWSIIKFIFRTVVGFEFTTLFRKEKEKKKKKES